jgi:TM2 domain-containing membrane protein YozV
MIRFACPVCRTAYQVPDDKAGHKRTCPSCGQRMQVPAPPPSSKTVLAPLLEYQPDPPALPATPAVAPMAMPILPIAQPAPESTAPSKRIVFGVMAIAFGFLGAHDFIVGRYLGGACRFLLCLLFCLAGILLVALILWAFAVAEGVYALTMTDEQFARTYGLPLP